MISKVLSGPPKPASASATMGSEPIALGAAFRMLDLVGALEGAVDAAAQLGAGIGRIERLVGIHGAGDIGIGRHLPAGEIDRLESGAGHLHGLVAGHGAERMDIVHARAAVATASAAPRSASVWRIATEPAQAQHVVGRIGTA